MHPPEWNRDVLRQKPEILHLLVALRTATVSHAYESTGISPAQTQFSQYRLKFLYDRRSFLMNKHFG